MAYPIKVKKLKSDESGRKTIYEGVSYAELKEIHKKNPHLRLAYYSWYDGWRFGLETKKGEKVKIDKYIRNYENYHN